MFEFNKKIGTNYSLFNILLSYDILFELNKNSIMQEDPYATQLYSSAIESVVTEMKTNSDINTTTLGLELSYYALSNDMKFGDRSIEEKSEQIIEFIKKYQNDILKYSSD